MALLLGVITLGLTTTLFAWLLRSTYYEIDGDDLRVVCGPFRKRIPVGDIASVEPSRSVWSSPALSLDRLRIRYGDKSILVSPADKRGFIDALGIQKEDFHD